MIDADNGSNADQNQVTAAVALAEKTLTGDLRDQILRLFRDERNPWHLMSEERQTLLAATVEALCESLVSRAVQIIAARDFPVIGVALDQVNFKPKGVEAKMTFGAMGAKTRHALVDAQGGGIVIVVADEKLYRGSRGLARVDKQEPELPLDGAAQPPAEAIGHDAEADDPGADGAADEAGSPGDDDAGAGDSEAADAAPGVALSNPAGPYTLGYEECRAGAQRHQFAAGSAECANYDAGWFQCAIDQAAEGEDRERERAFAAEHFRSLGLTAYRPGAILTDCPLAAWMPATKWWREGLLRAICEAGAAAARAGTGRGDNPYPEGTVEGDAWLSAWTAPTPGAGHPADQTPPDGRRRGRPRKSNGAEPPPAQPGA